MRFIEAHKSGFGVEPICTVLSEHGCPIAPSTYYQARHRAVSARAARDAGLKVKIGTVHKDNFGAYGARKVWLTLNREGTPVARCTVATILDEVVPAIAGQHCRRTREYPHWRPRFLPNGGHEISPLMAMRSPQV